MDDSRAGLVEASDGWATLLLSKAQAGFVGGLQTLAATALEARKKPCAFTLTAVGSAVPSG